MFMVAEVAVDDIQRFEAQQEVADTARLALAYRFESEGLVFFPGFAPGWGMSVRRFDTAPAEPAAHTIISRLMGSTAASIDSPTPQPNGV